MTSRIMKNRSLLLLDGGLATQIEAQGVKLHESLWSAGLLLDNPSEIVAAHRAYLDAGAECIIAASYQASRRGFALLGLGVTEADELIVSAVALAARARDEFLHDNPNTKTRPLIAASIGPLGAANHDGSEYTGKYDADELALREFHQQRTELLDDAGADILACETIPNAIEATVLASLLQKTKTPAWVSFSCRDGTAINDGSPVRDVAAIFAAHPTVFAVGINCTAPEYVLSLIAELQQAVPDKAVVVYPNSGECYHSVDNSWSGENSAVIAADAALTWHAAGATIIGGCCRMGPQHTRAMHEKTRRIM